MSVRVEESWMSGSGGLAGAPGRPGRPDRRSKAFGRLLGIGIGVGAVLLAAAACVYVDIDDEAKVVGVARSLDEVAHCEPRGRVNAKTTATVALVPRGETSVAVELERLARNDAVGLGANTIVPLGPVSEDGKRSYDAFACPE